MSDARAYFLCELFLLLVIPGCTSDSQHSADPASLSVLTLNLHTYQEMASNDTPEGELSDEQARERVAAYGPIFDRIAAGIEQLDPDIICLQEVGEWFGDAGAGGEFGAGESNMVRQILARLPARNYEHVMDWSHYGWDVWREGSAILSRLPMVSTDSRFISRPGNSHHDNWKSRNVLQAGIEAPGVGKVDVYSVHAGWWDDPEEPSQEQFQRLFDWVEESDAEAIFLCGDFNAPAGGPAYRLLTEQSGFADQYLLANPAGMLDPTVADGADGWEDAETGARIDYIFLNEDAALSVTGSRRVFTDAEFGQVSDHVGVFAEFELRTNHSGR